MLKTIYGTMFYLVFMFGCSFGGELLFYDDFVSNVLKPEWVQEKDGNDAWHISNGFLINDANTTGGLDLNLSERGCFSVQCELKMTKSTIRYPGFNIIFREKGEKTYYSLHLKPFEEHEKAFYYIWKFENGLDRKEIGHIFLTELDLDFRFDKIHKFSVSFGCDQILRFYWDEKLVLNKPNIFVSPDRITFNGSVGGNLHINKIAIHKDALSSTAERKIIYDDDFSIIESLKLSTHKNNLEILNPEKTFVRRKEGKSVLIYYNFLTSGHDAVLLSKNIDVQKADFLSVRIKGNGTAHKLFIVIKDKSGEAHYLVSSSLRYKGWHELNIALDEFTKTLLPGEVSDSCWGGDGNGIIDFPIKQLTVGINDVPDHSIESGCVELNSFSFYNMAAGVEN